MHALARLRSMSYIALQAGYEQDSHELLRLLLDGLNNEELKAARLSGKKKEGMERMAPEDKV